MFEHHKAPLPPRSVFVYRLLRSLLYALAIIAVSLSVGMCGYHYIEKIAWIDSFLEASMILSGMGPLVVPHTTAGKIFAGIFALYSGFALLATVGVVIAPILHRFLHKFHLTEENKK
ncbi:MAG TPA: hypothetical protein VN457_04855 [Chlamydiales bacterium]|nr:hypothetical protein [Chlamydiales bacterium]